MNPEIVVSIVLLSIVSVSTQETSRCFDDAFKRSGSQSETNSRNRYDERFRLTNYQGILRCAKTMSEDTIKDDIFGQHFNKCIWLDNLDNCIRRLKERNIDCEQPFKDLIQSFIQVNIFHIHHI